MLTTALPPQTVFALIGANGQVYISSITGEPGAEPLPAAATLIGDPRAQIIAPGLRAAHADFASWRVAGQLYRMRYEPVEPAPGLQMTVLVGVPAVPGLAAQVRPFVLPVSLVVLIALCISLLTLTLTGPQTAAIVNKSRVSALPRKRRLTNWLVLFTAIGIVGSATYGMDQLHRHANINRKAELLLVQIRSNMQRINDLQVARGIEHRSGDTAETQSIMQEAAAGVNDLLRLDVGYAAAQQVDVALRQYTSSVQQLDALLAEDRMLEAQAWIDQRIQPSYTALIGRISSTNVIYAAAASRADMLATVGTTLTVVAVVAMLGFLFWHDGRTRHRIDQLARDRRSEKRLRALVGNASDVVLILDQDSHMMYQSPGVERIWNYSAGVLDSTDALTLVHPDDVERARSLWMQALEKPGTNISTEVRIRVADGTWRHCEVIANNLLTDTDVEGIILTYRDVTERKAFEDQLTQLAFHDPLTRLPNRALFVARLEHALTRAERTNDGVAVIFLDLDNFKVVNDSLGHPIGDQLLIGVAQRLQECVRQMDTVARLGGDEFTILLEDIHDLRCVTDIAERIIEHLQEQFQIDGHDVYTGASIGVAVCRGARQTADDLMRDADLAMYRAKNNGKAHYALFDQSLAINAQHRQSIESDLRQALEGGQFRLQYQPVVNLNHEGDQ